MIVGIGHDLASIDRVQLLLQGKVGSRFISRILTESEQERANALSGMRRIEFIAGRFAAKEAVSKAFGCGIGSLLSFRDIEVGRDQLGKPICLLSEEAWVRLRFEKEQTAVHVTITHDKRLASAFVIIEQLEQL